MHEELKMLHEEKTKEEFGYTFDSLPRLSSKYIYLICDYCGSNYKCVKKNRVKSNKYCGKDACKNCKYKKREEVSLTRDGVKNSAQRSDVRKKISDSGWINSEEFKQKRKNTMIEKYGTDQPMLCDELKNKLKLSMIKKYGVENIMQYSDVAKKASKKSVETRIKRGFIKQIDGKTLPEHAKEFGFSRSHFSKLVNKYGFEEACLYEKQISSLEKSITIWLDNHNISYETQFRVDGKIADIRIGNILIECDGLYWHSDINLDKDYHYDKREIYIQNGYKPLFFRENEIRDKFDIVISIIQNAIGINQKKYFARKLRVDQIDHNASKEFVKQYHLMGPASNFSCSFGLFDGDELLSVIQLKRVKDNHYDVTRFCSKSCITICGGFSKLLKAFEKVYNPSSVTTFIDLRYGTGEYLNQLGFKKKTCYPSFSWTDCKNVYHRLKFPGNSGYEKGVVKIWDCGQLKYFKGL